MKKLFIIMAICLGISSQIYSQASALTNNPCGGTTSIPPQTGTHPFGLSPSDSILPCVVQGVAVSDTIYFTNLTTTVYSGLTVNVVSLTIDSIYAPSGLCWQTNSANNTFAGGANGVIHVSGTTNDSAGQYKLRIIVSVVGSYLGIQQTVSNLNAESEGLIYKIRVKGPYCNCPTIDNSRADSSDVFIPYPACPPTATITGHDTICPGDSTTLTAGSGVSYTYRWSTGARTQSITTASAGSYQVTVYQGSDSVVSAPVTVVQGFTPSATLTLHGSSAICPGSIDTISAPPSSSETYHWNTSATTSSITVNAAGSFTVTVTNGYGCSAVSSPEVITAGTSCGAPVAIINVIGHDTICPGGSVILAATPGTGYTYKWSNAAHSTSDSITVSTAGSYTVTVYHSGDSAVSAPTTIVVASPPSNTVTVTGSTTFCLGDSTQLSAVAGFSYLWSNNATTQSIEVSTSGSYTVTVTTSLGCSAVSSPEAITVNIPAADTITRSGQVLTSQAQTTYQWYQGATLLTGETAATYTATQNGVYSVEYTDANGCHGTSNAITVTGVGINEISSAIALKLYPNPSEGIFTLQAPGCEGNYYEITDELGRVVQSRVILSDNSIVDVSGQIDGVYYLTVKTGVQNQTIRFTVIK